jgi:protein TonB
MMIGGIHWLLAVGVALAIHLAGFLWLSLPDPVRQPMTEQAGESIVVSLGPDARRAAADVAALSPEESPGVEAAAEATAARPEPATSPSATVADEADTTPEAVASTPADTAQPVTPSDRQEVVESGPELAAPTPSDATESVDAGSPVPETVATREVTATKPAEAQTAAVELADIEASSVETADVEPDDIQAAEVETADVETPAAAVESPRVSPGPVETASNPEAQVTLPAEFAAGTPDPAPAGTSVTVEQAPAPVTEIATSRTVTGDTSTSSPETAEPVEESLVQTSRADPAREVESAQIAPAEQPGITATTARSPDPSVETASQPGVREALQPEVIDLQALQESGGGSGVAARYAGVLKGWLQNNMHYPRAARLAGQEGEVVVRFVIDRQGNVQSIVVESRSGFPLLDREAREMIERGDPFPPLPDDMPGQKLEIRVPVDFHVRDETMTKEIPPIYLE